MQGAHQNRAVEFFCKNSIIKPMNKENIQTIINNLEKTSQRVRGEVIIDHINYIKKKEGSGGLERLKEKLNELNIALDLEKITPEKWISNDLSSQIIIVAHHIFNWSNEDVFEMGYSAPRFPLGIKLLVQTVISPKKMFKDLPIYWKNIFSFGSLEPVEFNEELQHARMQIKNLKTTHPILCFHMQGYIKGLAEFIFSSKKITVKQSKCAFKGDAYDEYIIHWN